MQPSAVSIIFICIGAAAVLYFVYYFLIPIIACGYYLNHHYAKSKYEDGFFWVKLKKEDKDYWVYKIDMAGVRVRDICWYMLVQHKRAYKMYISGVEENNDTTDD